MTENPIDALARIVNIRPHQSRNSVPISEQAAAFLTTWRAFRNSPEGASLFSTNDVEKAADAMTSLAMTPLPDLPDDAVATILDGMASVLGAPATPVPLDDQLAQTFDNDNKGTI